IFDQAAQSSQSTDVFDAAASGQNESDWLKAIKGQDTNVPLTSHAAATKQGALNILQGVSQGVQGIGHAIAHPIDTLANIGDVATLGATHLLPGADKAA